MVLMNLDSAMDVFVDQVDERDLYLRVVTFSFASIGFLEIVRGQTPEIRVLQLVPGYYLFLVFCCFLFLLFFSNHLGKIQRELDEDATHGIKSIRKLATSIRAKIALFFLFLTLFLTVNNVIPVSFDSFEVYIEPTLENTWSVDEIIWLEATFLFILLAISQIPLIVFIASKTEFVSDSFPEYWRSFTFGTILLSGFLTPTIDGTTQLYFAGSVLSFYVLTVTTLTRKIPLRDPSIISFGAFFFSFHDPFSF
jgi:hypothetical protein